MNGLMTYQVLIANFKNNKPYKNYDEDIDKGYIPKVDAEYSKDLHKFV